MATKTHRWDTRVDEEVDALVADAASVLGVKRSVFIIDAAREKAERTLARAEITLIADDVFDSLIASLDAPDPAPNLEQIAAEPRRYKRV